LLVEVNSHKRNIGKMQFEDHEWYDHDDDDKEIEKFYLWPRL
jgi:hypothetical protein